MSDTSSPSAVSPQALAEQIARKCIQECAKHDGAGDDTWACEDCIVAAIASALAAQAAAKDAETEKWRNAALHHGTQSQRWRERLDAADAENARLKAAIRWALGEEGSFGEEPEPLAGKYRRRFWWRTELRTRAGLDVTLRAHVPAHGESHE